MISCTLQVLFFVISYMEYYSKNVTVQSAASLAVVDVKGDIKTSYVLKHLSGFIFLSEFNIYLLLRKVLRI